MSALPQGWALTSIDSVTTKAAQKIAGVAEKFTYIDIGSVSRETKQIINPEELLGKNAPSRARQLVKTGDVLVSMTRPNLNAVALVPDALDGQIASTGFDVLRPIAVESRWLFAAVRTADFVQAMTDLVQGALYPAVRPRDIRSYEITLPPLAEQNRIADKLDTMLTRLDAARERLDSVPALLKRFRQSVLASATSGELTEDWRGGEERKWQETPLVEICEKDRVITYGVIKLGGEIPNGVPCLRTSNVRWLNVDASGLKRIDKDLSDSYARTILRGGEVLVNVRGTLGGVASVDRGMIGWNVSREIAVIPICYKQANARFIALYVASDKSQEWLASVQKGVAYTGINIEDLRTLPVALPPLDEQAEIVRRTESLFAFADKVQTQYEAARARVEKLTSALLAKAFRGELVLQDPSDEPAEKLLERIRASKRIAEGSEKKKRKIKAT